MPLTSPLAPRPSPMPSSSRAALLVLPALMLAAACGNRSDTAEQTSPRASSVVVVAPPASAPATVVATAAASAAPAVPGAARPRRARTIKQVSSELAKRCAAKKPADTNMEMKVQMSETLDCMRKKMNADLDEVLLPLKKSDPPRFKALMAEQATWNRALEPSCRVEEELTWLNFDDGSRDDGTSRGTWYMSCLDTAITERVLYARALAAGDVASLSRRIDEVQKEGAAVRDHLADRKKAAVKWVVTPPAKTDSALPADWKAFSDDLGAIEKNTADLARDTCTGWPELARALGGDAACQKKAANYYALQGNSLPAAR